MRSIGELLEWLDEREEFNRDDLESMKGMNVSINSPGKVIPNAELYLIHQIKEFLHGNDN